MDDTKKIFKKATENCNPKARTNTYRTFHSKATSRGKSPRKVDEGNKTDEGLGDHLGVCQRCDDCGKMMKYESWEHRQGLALECGHAFCENCVLKIRKEAHLPTSCQVNSVKCRIPDWYDPDQPTKSERRNAEMNRKEYLSRSKLWIFEHKGRPVVVSLRRDATYGDLENSLALLLSVDLKTHMILIHLPNSYNGGDVNYFMKADDSLTNGPYEKDTKLKYLRYPRIVALSLDITEKKKPSSEPPSKESVHSPGTKSEPKNQK